MAYGIAYKSAKGKSDDVEVDFLAVTCLFLAAKVEEHPREIRSIVNVHTYLQPGREAAKKPPYFPQLDHSYWEMKERIVALEQDILRVLAFDANVTHPYTYAIVFAEALHCSRSVLHLALSVLNDSYCDPAICLHCAPHTVAAAAVYIARRLQNVHESVKVRTCDDLMRR